MGFELRGSQPAPNSVGAEQLKSGAVTSDKVEDGLLQTDPVGTSVSHSHQGTTRKRVEKFPFFTDASNMLNRKKLRLHVNLKTSNATHQADLEAWLNNNNDWGVGELYP